METEEEPLKAVSAYEPAALPIQYPPPFIVHPERICQELPEGPE
jgi:hypothetical protein